MTKTFEESDAFFAQHSGVHIVSCNFGYNNKHVIQRLIKRGTAFQNGIFKKLQQEEKKINSLMIFNEINTMKNIKRPVKAFIMLRSQENHNRVLKTFETDLNFNGRPKFKKDIEQNLTFLGIPMECREAPEPTNIRWENQCFEYGHQNKKKVQVYIQLAIFLGCVFYLIGWLK